MSLLKEHKINIRYAFLAAMFCILVLPDAKATNTVTPSLVWFKPIESDHLMQGNTIIKGDALDLMLFVANQINHVEHKFEAYPIRRSWRLIQNTKQENLAYCFWGADYKKERENWGYFTQPTSVVLPYLVAARKGKLDEFAQNGTVSVNQLLKQGYSTVIFEKVLNAWTKVVEQAGYNEVVQISGLDKDLSDHTVLMIEKGRIDFGYVSHRAIANLDVDNNDPVRGE